MGMGTGEEVLEAPLKNSLKRNEKKNFAACAVSGISRNKREREERGERERKKKGIAGTSIFTRSLLSIRRLDD